MMGMLVLTPVLGWLSAALVSTTRRYTLEFNRSPSAELLAALLLFALRDLAFTSALFRVLVIFALVVALVLAGSVARSTKA
jgi:hypothetical protein